jgi:UPF0755 protein
MVRRSRRKKKGLGAAGLFFLLVLLILIAGGAAAWFIFLPFGPSHETFVEIAPGSSSSLIATQLEKAGVIRSRYGFDLVRLWKHGTLKAGEYRFDRSASVTEVYARIARGDVYTIAVTIPEGATLFDIASRVAQAGFPNVQKEDFLMTASTETPLIADLDPQAKNLEGYLFPDTYRFPRNVAAKQIVVTMVRRFRTAAAGLGLIPDTNVVKMHSVVTLASLVERETAVASERPLVASVLTNRLNKNMPLMTDPAVAYGLEVAGKWRGTIYASDLSDAKHDTPYNTYRHAGLPPGPICNPGLPSLRAALHPAATDYLYFVAAGADPQGQSRFAATLEEHNKNVASYRQAVKQAGGH